MVDVKKNDAGFAVDAAGEPRTIEVNDRQGMSDNAGRSRIEKLLAKGRQQRGEGEDFGRDPAAGRRNQSRDTNDDGARRARNNGDAGADTSRGDNPNGRRSNTPSVSDLDRNPDDIESFDDAFGREGDDEPDTGRQDRRRRDKDTDRDDADANDGADPRSFREDTEDDEGSDLRGSATDPDDDGGTGEGEGGDGNDDADGLEDLSVSAPNAAGEVVARLKGKKYVIPKPLVDGAMRQADYTRKTTELTTLANHVAKAQAQATVDAKFLKELAIPEADLQNMAAAIKDLRGRLPDPAVDLPGFVAANKQLTDLKDAHAELSAAVGTRRTELTAEQQSARAELLRAGNEYLVKAIKGFSVQTGNQIADYFVKQGFSQAELDNMTDPKVWVIAHKAMAYQKLLDSKPAVRNRIANVAPVVRPTGKTTSQANAPINRARDAVRTARRTGRESDAQRAMFALLQGSKKRR